MPKSIFELAHETEQAELDRGFKRGSTPKTKAYSEPCYAPSFECVTHKCSIDKCWKEGRCDALYALGR